MMRIGLIFMVSLMLQGCALSPRMSSWDSPPPYQKAQVFKAALKAGVQDGYHVKKEDVESGMLTFEKEDGYARMTFVVHVTEEGGLVHVACTADYSIVTSAGDDEAAINAFHSRLFKILNISNPAELGNVRIVH